MHAPIKSLGALTRKEKECAGKCDKREDLGVFRMQNTGIVPHEQFLANSTQAQHKDREQQKRKTYTLVDLGLDLRDGNARSKVVEDADATVVETATETSLKVGHINKDSRSEVI